MKLETQRTSEPKIRERAITVKGRSYQRFDVDFGTEGGRRNRQSFPSKGEALRAIATWSQQQKTETEKQTILAKRVGQYAKKLTNDDILDAALGLDVLQRCVTLEEAARFYMRHNRPTGGRRTVEEAAKEFLTSRQERGCRPLTVRAYEDKLDQFGGDMNGRPLTEITMNTVEGWLRDKGFKTVTRASVMRHLGAFFQWAVKKQYIAQNPIGLLDMPRMDKTPVLYLTPDEIEVLLEAATTHDSELVPYVALAAFAGLRPIELHGVGSEHGPLDWRHIDLKRGKVIITAQHDRNRRGRLVDVTRALAGWLLPHQRPSGPIVYTRERFNAVVRKSGITYTKDCLRHSFGTYHYAAHHHEGDTAVQLGDTIATVKERYVNPLVDKETAAQFWAIRPTTAAGTVQFKTA